MLVTSSAGRLTCLSLSVSQVVLGFLCEADYKLVAKAIRHRVTAIKRQRDKRRHLLEEEPDPAAQPPETANQKPSAATGTSASGKGANQVCLYKNEKLPDQQKFVIYVLKLKCSF